MERRLLQEAEESHAGDLTMVRQIIADLEHATRQGDMGSAARALGHARKLLLRMNR